MNDDGSKDHANEMVRLRKASERHTPAMLGLSRKRKLAPNERSRESVSNLPMNVQDAAQFLGVSPQTVYLWVERKQIPHFRVMGRNIRFLRSDLKPFRTQFRQEVEMARPRKHDGVVYRRLDSNVWWMRYRDRDGTRRLESTNTIDWDEAQQRLRERLDARDKNSLAAVRKGKQLTFGEWADFFLVNYSQPPIRAPKTHEANENALKSLRPVFGDNKLVDIEATQIEFHLRARLQQRRRVRRSSGVVELGTLHATSVHQEFRVLRRIFSVAVKKKLVPTNPCSSVEFPVAVKGLFRPHYMTWSEQMQIEEHAPIYLRNVIRIVTETGLRIYKELASMKKEQVDIANEVVFIADSKTPTGVSEVPLTDMAAEAFKKQLNIAGPGPWLFPSSRNPEQHQQSFKKTWKKTLQRAGVRNFRIYDLRSTYATRLSAGGVADEWVTQMLRQTDAKVFKKYSQMKLQMKREALKQLKRQAGDCEAKKGFDTEEDE